MTKTKGSLKAIKLRYAERRRQEEEALALMKAVSAAKTPKEALPLMRQLNAVLAK